MCCRTKWFETKKLQLFKHVSQQDDKSGHNCRSFKKFLNNEDDKKVKGQEPTKITRVFQALLQEKNEQGNTALHCAAKAGNLKICKLLENNGIAIDIKNYDRMTPLEFAARYGDGKSKDVFSCIKWLMEKNKKEKTRVTETSCILQHAIQNRNWAEDTYVARELIKSGKCRISEYDDNGNTSLHLALKSPNEEEHKILDLFLENENVNDEDLAKCLERENKKGRTPYHIACSVGNHEVVQLLINKGKDLDVNVGGILNSRDVDGHLPIYAAIDTDNIKLLDVLMSHNFDLHMTKNDISRAAR